MSSKRKATEGLGDAIAVVSMIVNTTNETIEFNLEIVKFWTLMDYEISVISKHFAYVIDFADTDDVYDRS